MSCKKNDMNFKDVDKPHEKLMKSFELPEWIVGQNCTKCNEILGHLSIRSIGLKTNAQHIGNFFIEVCCQHCKYGYDLHMKKACTNVKDLINLLQSKAIDKNFEPDYLMSNSENNLVQNIVKEKQNGDKKTQ